jgi:hypothetical protein
MSSSFIACVLLITLVIEPNAEACAFAGLQERREIRVRPPSEADVVLAGQGRREPALDRATAR